MQGVGCGGWGVWCRGEGCRGGGLDARFVLSQGRTLVRGPELLGIDSEIFVKDMKEVTEREREIFARDMKEVPASQPPASATERGDTSRSLRAVSGLSARN